MIDQVPWSPAEVLQRGCADVDANVAVKRGKDLLVMNRTVLRFFGQSRSRTDHLPSLHTAAGQQSRVDAARGDISRLEKMIADTRQQLTQGNEQRASLAAITGELRIAESDLATRQELLAAAAAQMEGARIEANKQVRYLSLSVAPVPPDEATYPKAVQNTIVAFLIFSGIYLMLSLTVSILREQVST